jgi:zinc protease
MKMKSISPTNHSALPGPQDITRVTLPNGITLLTRSNFNSPSVSIGGYLAAGSMYDPIEKLGLAGFTALSLMRGTQRRNFQEIYNLLESAGASLGFGASVHNVSFGGRALAEDLPMLLGLLADALCIPAFPEEQVERLRSQLLTSLSIRDQDTGDQADMAVDEILFPNHPYGRPEDGYQQTIQPITREDLAAFHQSHYGPGSMVMVIVGAVEPQAAVEQVQKALGDWVNPNQPQQPDLPQIEKLSADQFAGISFTGQISG